MGRPTAVKHPVPDRVKSPFVVFDVTSGHSGATILLSSLKGTAKFRRVTVNKVVILQDGCQHYSS